MRKKKQQQKTTTTKKQQQQQKNNKQKKKTKKTKQNNSNNKNNNNNKKNKTKKTTKRYTLIANVLSNEKIQTVSEIIGYGLFHQKRVFFVRLKSNWLITSFKITLSYFAICSCLMYLLT